MLCSTTHSTTHCNNLQIYLLTDKPPTILPGFQPLPDQLQDIRHLSDAARQDLHRLQRVANPTDSINPPLTNNTNTCRLPRVIAPPPPIRPPPAHNDTHQYTEQRVPTALCPVPSFSTSDRPDQPIPNQHHEYAQTSEGDYSTTANSPPSSAQRYSPIY